MEEPGGRFAHGFFRRTGGAGSVTAPRRGTATSAGAWEPIPIQRHTAFGPPVDRGLRRDLSRGSCLLPHCDASRARPSSGADLRQGYSPGWDYCQEQSENITLLSVHLRCHPGTAQQGPGSIATTSPQRVIDLTPLSAPLAVMDPGLRCAASGMTVR